MRIDARKWNHVGTRKSPCNLIRVKRGVITNPVSIGRRALVKQFFFMLVLSLVSLEDLYIACSVTGFVISLFDKSKECISKPLRQLLLLAYPFCCSCNSSTNLIPQSRQGIAFVWEQATFHGCHWMEGISFTLKQDYVIRAWFFCQNIHWRSLPEKGFLEARKRVAILLILFEKLMLTRGFLNASCEKNAPFSGILSPPSSKLLLYLV